MSELEYNNNESEIDHLKQKYLSLIDKISEAEHKIKEEAGRAQDYLNIAGVAIVALDNRGTITLLNKKGHKMDKHRTYTIKREGRSIG